MDSGAVDSMGHWAALLTLTWVTLFTRYSQLHTYCNGVPSGWSGVGCARNARR